VRVGTERSKGKHNFGNDRPAGQTLGRRFLRDDGFDERIKTLNTLRINENFRLG